MIINKYYMASHIHKNWFYEVNSQILWEIVVANIDLEGKTTHLIGFETIQFPD